MPKHWVSAKAACKSTHWDHFWPSIVLTTFDYLLFNGFSFRKMVKQHLWPGKPTWRNATTLTHCLHDSKEHDGTDRANIEESHWEVDAFQEPNNYSQWLLAKHEKWHTYANDCLTSEIYRSQPEGKYLQKLLWLLCSAGCPPLGLGETDNLYFGKKPS